MNPKDQKAFDEALKKDITGLTRKDIIILRARRGYLTPEQRIKYAEVIGEGVKTDNTMTPTPKEDKLAVFRDLMKQAKAKGITVPKGTKIDELKLMLS